MFFEAIFHQKSVSFSNLQKLIYLTLERLKHVLAPLLHKTVRFALISQIKAMGNFVSINTLLPKNRTPNFFRQKKNSVERAVTQFKYSHG